MKKLSLLLFVACCISIIFSPAYAGMTSESYAIPSLTVSSGGAPSLESTGYRLHDLKGQGVIGVSTKDAFTAELGGLYGELGAAVVERPGLPWGSVPLYISRNGSNIRLTWEASVFINPKIYVMTGAGSGEYVNAYDVARWTKVAEGGSIVSGLPAGLGTFRMITGILTHEGQVGAGTSEAYYKAIQAGVNPDTLITGTTVQCFTSAEAVGKVNYIFSGGNTFFAVPFILTGTVNDIMSYQRSGVSYTSGSRIYKQADDRSGFNTSNYGTAWSNDITIVPDKGYYFYNTGSEIPITLSGKVPTAAVPETMLGGNTLFGIQFPSSYSFSIFGTGVAPGDRVLIHNRSAIPYPGFDSVSRSEFGTTSVRLNGIKGYYYQRDTSATAPLTWTPPKP